MAVKRARATCGLACGELVGYQSVTRGPHQLRKCVRDSTVTAVCEVETYNWLLLRRRGGPCVCTLAFLFRAVWMEWRSMD